MPLDPVAQVKSDGQVVGGDLPRFGQFAGQLQVFVVADQAVVDQAVDVGGGAVGSEHRQQGGGVADRPHDDGIAVGRLGRLPLGRHDAGLVPVAAGENEKDGKD